MALQPVRRRFSVDEYDRIAQAGILSEDDRVELVEGEIIEMTPIGRRHAMCVRRLTELLGDRFRPLALIDVQNPLRLSDFSEPQPDLALLRREASYYAAGHPTPADVYLLIEVAETSVELDRRLKVPLYARHGISELWLVDLEQETVTVYREPTPDGYRTVRVLRRGEELAPLAFPVHPLAIADVLG